MEEITLRVTDTEVQHKSAYTSTNPAEFRVCVCNEACIGLVLRCDAPECQYEIIQRDTEKVKG